MCDLLDLFYFTDVFNVYRVDFMLFVGKLGLSLANSLKHYKDIYKASQKSKTNLNQYFRYIFFQTKKITAFNYRKFVCSVFLFINIYLLHLFILVQAKVYWIKHCIASIKFPNDFPQIWINYEYNAYYLTYILYKLLFLSNSFS